MTFLRKALLASGLIALATGCMKDEYKTITHDGRQYFCHDLAHEGDRVTQIKIVDDKGHWLLTYSPKRNRVKIYGSYGLAEFRTLTELAEKCAQSYGQAK